jgi:Variant SH3 domain
MEVQLGYYKKCAETLAAVKSQWPYNTRPLETNSSIIPKNEFVGRQRSQSRPQAHAYTSPYPEDRTPSPDAPRPIISTKFKSSTIPLMQGSSAPQVALRRVQTDTPPRPNSTNGSQKRKTMRVDHAFDAESDSEMSFLPGETVAVIEEVDAGWFMGEVIGSEGTRRGLFPATYCSVVEEFTRRPAPTKPLVSPVKVSSVRTSPSQEDDLTKRLGYVRNATLPPQTITTTKKKFPPPPPPPPAPRGSKPTVSSLPASETQCRECGCNEFRLNVFKKDNSCNNCFHVHM